jgi:hypothetical protein
MSNSSELPSLPVSPLLFQALCQEHWFGDDDPAWTGALSSQKAAEKRLTCIIGLRRFGDGRNGVALVLADLLERCTPKRRCMSGACPECMRAFQRWFVASVHTLSRGDPALDALVAVSIGLQPSRDQSFFEIAPDAVNKTGDVTLTLDGSPSVVKWMAGALDFHLSDLREKNIGLIWQPQLRAIASVSDPALFQSLLKRQFPKSNVVTTPVQVKPCDGSLSSCSGAYKTEFFERRAYRRHSTRNGETREFWTTRRLRLSDIDHACLLVWLHEIGLVRRLYLWGVRMTMVDTAIALIPQKEG